LFDDLVHTQRKMPRACAQRGLRSTAITHTLLTDRRRLRSRAPWRSQAVLSENEHDFDLAVYRVALETRKLEIRLFWQRSNYFLVLSTALAIGYFSHARQKAQPCRVRGSSATQSTQ